MRRDGKRREEKRREEKRREEKRREEKRREERRRKATEINKRARKAMKKKCSWSTIPVLKIGSPQPYMTIFTARNHALSFDLDFAFTSNMCWKRRKRGGKASVALLYDIKD